MINQEFVENLLKYKGTKFEYYGRSKEGIDCFGLYICARNDIERLKKYDFLDYSCMPRNKHFIKEVLKTANPINNNVFTLVPGHIILLTFKRGLPQHLCIYIGDNKIIHANKKSGKVEIEDFSEYEKYVHSIYQLKDKGDK